jgi:hypothetical protein
MSAENATFPVVSAPFGQGRGHYTRRSFLKSAMVGTLASSLNARSLVGVEGEEHNHFPLAKGGEFRGVIVRGQENAWRLLCQAGLCVEVASAVPIACARNLRATGRIAETENIVCLLTGAGSKWPELLAARSRRKPISGTEIVDPHALIEALGETTVN